MKTCAEVSACTERTRATDPIVKMREKRAVEMPRNARVAEHRARAFVGVRHGRARGAFKTVLIVSDEMV